VHARLRWWVFGAVGFALIVGTVLGWHAAHSTGSIRTINERRLTANAAELPVTDGVISPDGKYLAFTDASGFHLRQVDSGETHTITLPVGFNARPRSWFPDGTHLLATSVAGPQEPEGIWEISLMGGSPRKLVERGTWPAVRPDGTMVAYLASATQFKETSLNKEIWITNADGENPHKVMGGGDDVFGPPAWSPDGKRLAYMRGRFSAGMPWIRCQLEITNLSTGETNVLVAAPELGSTIAWAPDGRLIYSLGEAPPNQNDSNLWALRLDSWGRVLGNATRLTRGPGVASLISVTSDGKRLAFFRQAVEPDVYVADLAANGTRLTSPRRLTLDDRADFPYSWTPDSQSVIFVSDRNGAFNVFRQGMQDTEPELLVRGREDMIVPRLSPDGHDILFLVTPSAGATADTKTRLMRVPLTGGPPQTVLEAPGISNQQCARLPSTVCILSRYQPGKEQFFFFDPEKGLGAQIAKAEINSVNSFDFNWSLSADGRMLVMARKEGIQQVPTIRLLPVGEGAEKTIPVPGFAGVGSLDWAADSKSVWATGYNSDASKSLLNITLTGKVRSLLSEKAMTLGWAIPSPDGKHLALWKAHGDSNVWMLENF
jgi:Tol biopolymer transport system component